MMDHKLYDENKNFLPHVSFGHGVYHSNRKIAETEISTRSLGIAVTDLTMIWEDCERTLEAWS